MKESGDTGGDANETTGNRLGLFQYAHYTVIRHTWMFSSIFLSLDLAGLKIAQLPQTKFNRQIAQNTFYVPNVLIIEVITSSKQI